MRVEVAWRTPPRARPAPNLITVDQASLETSVDGWGWPGAAFVNDSERSDDIASDGAWSMKVTRSPTGPANVFPMLSDPASQDTVFDFGDGHVLTGVAATPGVLYTAVGDVRAATVPRVVRVSPLFFDAAGAQLESSSSPFFADRTDRWTTLRASAIAPAGTTHASILATVLAVDVGESHYFDRLGILEDGANQWVLPGAQLWWRVDEADEAADTAALRQLKVGRGARIKVADMEASEAELVVDNRNRALDPRNSESPYAPHVQLRRRLRTVAELPAGDVDVFSGFIERLPTGWEQQDGWVTITAGDLLSLIAGDELTHSEFELSLLGQMPVGPGAGAPPAPDHWWRLDEDHGRVAADQIAGKDGRYEFDLQSADPLLPFEGGRGNEFFGNEPPNDSVWGPGKRGRVVTVPSFMAGPMPFAFDAWVRLTRPPRPLVLGGNIWTDAHVLFRQATSSFTQMHLSVRWSDDPLEHGRFYFQWFHPPEPTLVVGPFEAHPSIVDGNTHHVRVIVDNTFPGGDLGVSLIVDGVIEGPVGPFTVGTRDPTFASTMSLGLHGLVPVGADNFAGAGICAHVAWWHSLLLHDVTNLYFQAGTLRSAGLAPRANELTGARIDRVLDIVGVDPADRDIDPGTEICGPAEWRGQNCAAYLRGIVATEQGPLYVGPGGRITFRPRVANDPPPVIALAGKTDPLDPDLVPYSDLDVDHSLDRVINVAEASAAGIEHPVRVEHATSIGNYGPLSTGGAIQTVAASIYQLRSIGARLISRNHDPRTIITGLTINGRSGDVEVATILALDIADAAQVHATPPGPGEPIDQRSLIERIDHTFDYQAQTLTTQLGVVEHVILPTLAWDTAGRGWDESVWDPDT